MGHLRDRAYCGLAQECDGIIDANKRRSVGPMSQHTPCVSVDALQNVKERKRKIEMLEIYHRPGSTMSEKGM